MSLFRGVQKLLFKEQPVVALYVGKLNIWPDPWWDTWLDDGWGTWAQCVGDTWADSVAETWDAFVNVKEVK
jgi:hypothetical protein